MTAVPTPKTWVDNEKPDWKTFGTEIFDTLDFLFNPPMCFLQSNVSTAFGNTTDTPMPFTGVLVDMPGTQAMFKSSQNTRVTPKTPGRYLVIHGSMWSDGACGCAGSRQALIRWNGSTYLAGRMWERSGSGDAALKIAQGVTAPTIVFNGTTDYIELVQWTDGGATANGDVTQGFRSQLYVRWVARD